jgi:protein-disulfide isomerase
MRGSLGWFRRILVFGLMVAAPFGALAPGARADVLSTSQKAAVQELIHDYILAHPDVLTQALQEQQSAQAKRQAKSQQAAIADAQAALLDDPETPVLGNPKGSVTMVEFADYQCGYCRAMEPVVKNLISENPELRVVMKDLPILGPGSDYAARVGLAAARQGKYAGYRKAVLAQPEPMDSQEVWKAAAAAGLNEDAARKEMKQPWVETELAQDRRLAGSLGIDGTPAFIIGDGMILGGVPQRSLEDSLKRVGG